MRYAANMRLQHRVREMIYRGPDGKMTEGSYWVTLSRHADEDSAAKELLKLERRSARLDDNRILAVDFRIEDQAEKNLHLFASVEVWSTVGLDVHLALETETEDETNDGGREKVSIGMSPREAREIARQLLNAAEVTERRLADRAEERERREAADQAARVASPQV